MNEESEGLIPYASFIKILEMKIWSEDESEMQIGVTLKEEYEQYRNEGGLIQWRMIYGKVR